MKSGNLNFLEPLGPLPACNGTALPLLVTFTVQSNTQRYCMHFTHAKHLLSVCYVSVREIKHFKLYQFIAHKSVTISQFCASGKQICDRKLVNILQTFLSLKLTDVFGTAQVKFRPQSNFVNFSGVSYFKQETNFSMKQMTIIITQQFNIRRQRPSFFWVVGQRMLGPSCLQTSADSLSVPSSSGLPAVSHNYSLLAVCQNSEWRCYI